MSKKTKKNQQHIVPSTYLKYFQIADEPSFVYCINKADQFRTGAQKKGIKDKIFKRKKYYNTPKYENNYIIEDVLGQAIEPQYEQIMDIVINEQTLDQDAISKLMHWLCVSKMRSPYVRDNTERVMNWSLKMAEMYRKKDISEDELKSIAEISKATAKEIHLDQFSDRDKYKKTLELYVETLNLKHWEILKSPDSFPFWTNDNPGFSPNLQPQGINSNSFHQVMELNGHSIIFFVLSPKYCLRIRPFVKDTPLNICALNMKVEYLNVDHAFVDSINRGVFETSIDLIISNQKETLEACIRK